MKIEISNPIKNVLVYSKVDLPRSSQPYHEIYSYTGRGDFISAVIRFNSDRVDFKMELDGVDVADINLDDLNALLGYYDQGTRACFNYDGDKRSLEIDFKMPVEFKSSMKFYARADSGSTSRDLLGYQITFTEFEG